MLIGTLGFAEEEGRRLDTAADDGAWSRELPATPFPDGGSFLVLNLLGFEACLTCGPAPGADSKFLMLLAGFLGVFWEATCCFAFFNFWLSRKQVVQITQVR